MLLQLAQLRGPHPGQPDAKLLQRFGLALAGRAAGAVLGVIARVSAAAASGGAYGAIGVGFGLRRWPYGGRFMLAQIGSLRGAGVQRGAVTIGSEIIAQGRAGCLKGTMAGDKEYKDGAAGGRLEAG